LQNVNCKIMGSRDLNLKFAIYNLTFAMSLWLLFMVLPSFVWVAGKTVPATHPDKAGATRP